MSDPKIRPASRRKRLAKFAGATAAVLVLATAGTGAWYYHRLDGNLTTFDAGGIATSRPPAPTPTKVGGGLPVNVLLLGSDTRNDGNGDLGGGDEGVGHSDTAILLHVYGDRRHAVAVSIPRDTLVTIPPCKQADGKWTTARGNQMFNSAFTIGGSEQGNPACSQNTVEALTGLRIDHTIVVDFKGFAAMTEAVKGVDVCVPNAVDSYGIHLEQGRQTLAGQLALDYVRARHGFGDGSDIGRIKRQQAFLSSLIKKVQDQGFNLTTLLPLADAASRSLTVDPGLGTPMKLVDFAQSLQDIKLSDIEFVTVPWRYQGDRVALVHPDVDQLWNLLRQDRTLDGQSTGLVTAAPSEIPSIPAVTTPVVLLNATRTPDLAARTAETLKAQGYTAVTVGPTPTSTRKTTLIAYPPALIDAAEALARHFPTAALQPDRTADGLTVTLGRDLSPSTPGDTPTTAPTPSGTGVPTGITDNTRTADSDLCSNLTFG
ncbi:LCP family protein [Kitasatospora sp. NPDC101801]|uniref:LCP family protein n=1 Tax=Kitasatospora sp. NPDC101801 TaxID=3364103 RepID=UPI00381CC803